MTGNEKVLVVALLAATAFGLWYWYKNGQFTAAYNAAGATGGSPS